jgi:hypothetical protein
VWRVLLMMVCPPASFSASDTVCVLLLLLRAQIFDK